MEKRHTVSHMDIARELHITQSTVSRALDPKRCHLISEATRQRVIETAKRLGFCSNIHARRTRLHSSEAISLVMDAISYTPATQLTSFTGYNDFNEFSQNLNFEIISGVIDGAAELDFEVKFLPLHSHKPIDYDYLRTHLQFPYSDGMISMGFNRTRDFSQLMADLHIPHLMVANSWVPDMDLPQVVPAALPGVRQAVAVLAERGITRLYFQALDTSCQSLYYQHDRLGAWKKALQPLQLELEILQCHVKDDICALARNITSQPQPFAVLTTNDGLAMAWYNELRRLNVSIPGTAHIIGFDGNSAYPDLSSVAIDYYQLGRQAALDLVSAIKSDTDVSGIKEIDTSFKTGKTC